jgi:hypothetical protein
MKDSWLDRHLLPLQIQKGYDLKKSQCRVLFEQLGPTEIASDSTSHPHKKRGREVWLSTRDGRVGGCADAILKTDGGDAIVDYKSGKIFDDGANGLNKALKEHDVIQLKLYSALYYCNHGFWPQSIHLASFDGRFVDVPFTAEDCLMLLVESYQLMTDVNKTIAEANAKSVINRLAQPSPKNCPWCAYRPCCAPYWRAKAERSSETWPFDFFGELLEIKQLGNGLLIVKLRQKSAPSETLAIRGLSPDRHPALIIKSKLLSFFSVLPDKGPNAYHEGLLTTVYSAARAGS